MTKLPQVNVRLAPEYHDLIRELARRLRADPSLAVGLAEFLAQTGSSAPPQVSPLTHGLAAEVAALMERVDALEQRMDGTGRTGAAPPRQPRAAQAGKRGGPKYTDDLHRQIHDLRAKGMVHRAIAKELGISASGVTKYLNRPLPAERQGKT
jgi:DNA-binding NarL/FixJ family response regulator